MMAQREKVPAETKDASHGSRTMTITATDSSDPPKINITARDTSENNETEEKKPRRRITWSDDTVDNENMNKKSSKG